MDGAGETAVEEETVVDHVRREKTADRQGNDVVEAHRGADADETEETGNYGGDGDGDHRNRCTLIHLCESRE